MRVNGWLKASSPSPPDLTRTAVSPRINRTENDDSTCLDPLPQTTFDFD